METIELRKKTNVLQAEIRKLINAFYQDVGKCQIDIDCNQITIDDLNTGEAKFLRTEIQVRVTV